MVLMCLRERRPDGRAVVNSDILKEKHLRSRKANVRANIDVLMEIASYLDIRSLTNWRKSSPEAEVAVSTHLNHEYNKMLAAWFEDPTGFRDMLRITDSVISGSASLRFLQRTGSVDWKAEDLDIYTPSTYALRLVLYLIHVEDYQFDDVNRPTYHFDSKGFLRVYHLSKNGRSVDVIQSVTLSALHPLPFFWGSHVITFVGADEFCLPYPVLTLQLRAVLNPIALVDFEYPRTRTVRCIHKYEARGYSIRRSYVPWNAAAQCNQTHEACTRIPRYFGDKLCLMGSFRTNATPVVPSKSGRMPIWWLGGRACDHACDDADPFQRYAMPTVETVRVQDAVQIARR